MTNADTDLASGIQAVNKALLEGRVVINSSLKHLRQSLNQVVWNPLTSKPEPSNFDHEADCLRYMVRKL
ncbi:hypothetical protein, partial [Methylobacterium crusticola]|uniref:hypothetical protein n=1 Tax=Methylobacterium crusticola TaxID=1697972 RepID=UPI001EE1E686